MEDLYYYHEAYVYAHYKMEEYRNNSDLFEQTGGGTGMTLEQFKQKIRDKIMAL